MSFDLICSNCGAPSGPSVGICPFCKAVMTGDGADAEPAALSVIEKAYQDGKFPEALNLATAAADTPELSGDPRFLELYARILIEIEGPSSKIRSLLAKALLLEPGNARLQECLEVAEARTHFTRELNDEGELRLRKVLKSSPQNATALFILGAHLFWVQGETDESRRLLEKASQLQPNHLRTWGCLGEIYKKLGNAPLAAKAFGKCLTLETDPAMRNFFEERAKA